MSDASDLCQHICRSSFTRREFFRSASLLRAPVFSVMSERQRRMAPDLLGFCSRRAEMSENPTRRDGDFSVRVNRVFSPLKSPGIIAILSNVALRRIHPAFCCSWCLWAFFDQPHRGFILALLLKFPPSGLEKRPHVSLSFIRTVCYACG